MLGRECICSRATSTWRYHSCPSWSDRCGGLDEHNREAYWSCPAGWDSVGWDSVTLSTFIPISTLGLQHSGLLVHDSTCLWHQHYPVLSFMINGHLSVEYDRLSGWLGLPPCSDTQWHRIIERPCHQISRVVLWSGTKKILWIGVIARSGLLRLMDFTWLRATTLKIPLHKHIIGTDIDGIASL